MTAKVVRLGVSLEPALLALLDRWVQERNSPSRSDAIRALIRKELSERTLSDPDADALGVVALLYRHESPNVLRRLTAAEHRWGEHVRSTTHVHLEGDACARDRHPARKASGDRPRHRGPSGRQGHTGGGIPRHHARRRGGSNGAPTPSRPPAEFGVVLMVKHRLPPAADALARLALDRFLAVRPGEAVTIEAWTHGLPWALPFVLEARRLGAEPTLVVEDEETFFRSLAGRARRPPAQAPVAPVVSSGRLRLLRGPGAVPASLRPPGRGPRNGAGPARPGLVGGRDAGRASSGPHGDQRRQRRRPRNATASNLGAWSREILTASGVTPNRLRARGGRWMRRLSRARAGRIRHPNGTDLTVGVRPRGMILEDGAVDRDDRRAGRFWTQIPTGFLAVPIQTGKADGSWEANRPVYDRLADPPVALGARFEFSQGRLRQFAFDRGGEPFAAARAAGGPGSDLVGAIILGLNPGIDHAPELAEIALGSVSVLIGNDRAVGGRNRARFEFLSTLAGASVDVDGLPWLVEGRERSARSSAHGTATSPPRRPSRR